MDYRYLNNESHCVKTRGRDYIFRALGYFVKCIFVLPISVYNFDCITVMQGHESRRSPNRKGFFTYIFAISKRQRDGKEERKALSVAFSCK